jgi:hypothetical protein
LRVPNILLRKDLIPICRVNVSLITFEYKVSDKVPFCCPKYLISSSLYRKNVYFGQELYFIYVYNYILLKAFPIKVKLNNIFKSFIRKAFNL